MIEDNMLKELEKIRYNFMNLVKNVIDEEKIFSILNDTQNPGREKVLEVLAKAEKMKGLELEEIGCLINADEPELMENFLKLRERSRKKFMASVWYYSRPVCLELLH